MAQDIMENWKISCCSVKTEKWFIPHLKAINVSFNLKHFKNCKVDRLLGMMFESGTLDGNGRMEDLVVKKIPEFFLHFTP